jgi:hypothetical protein
VQNFLVIHSGHYTDALSFPERLSGAL